VRKANWFEFCIERKTRNALLGPAQANKLEYAYDSYSVDCMPVYIIYIIYILIQTDSRLDISPTSTYNLQNKLTSYKMFKNVNGSVTVL
jgi:hypothetical protein